ncbi:MAG: hypothetical protein H7Y17_09005 [Chlorobia bacterium]|nr:hypothetical protein [Fimbriimonadaceae bacterium]
MRQNVQSLLARRVGDAATSIVTTTKAMPSERLTWIPLDNGRCVSELLADCIHGNSRVAKIIPTRSFENLPEAPDWKATDLPELHRLLLDSAEKYAEVVMAVPDEDLEVEFDAPWGKIVLGDGLFHPYWNMVYHEGQINYIQTLYGDKEMHF